MKSRPFFVAIILLSASALTALADKVSEISQYDITWKFAAPVEAGKYVTGDWWVIAPVKVTSITPGPVDGLNGSVVNPPAGDKQGYDKRGPNFDATMVVQLPLDLKTGDALVSTESLETVGSVPPDSLVKKGHPQDVLHSCAVLTCVDKVPPADAFRPAYVGTWRETYRVAQLRRELLPGLEPQGKTDIALLQRTLERPWLDHKRDFTSGYLHPLANIPEYGREITTATSDSALLALVKNPDETVLERFVQKGIDYYGVVMSNSDIWTANGGHDSGRKWPIIFAGILLNNPDMMHVKATFAEDQQTYYGKRFGATTDSALWTISPGAINEKHEETDPATWETSGKGINNGTRSENYRRLNGPTWVGQALAARIMGATDLWDHPAYFEYVDRWMKEEGDKGSYGISLGMWKAYRDKADEMGAETKKKMGPVPAAASVPAGK